jgi:ATP-dependent 26S proteasome regulatory subunit
VTAAATTAWQQANRRDLAARLAYLRGLLERALGRTPEPLTAQAYEPNPSLAVPRIAKLFGLSNFETELLVLCAAVELDSTIAGLCAELHGDPRRPRPSFGLAMTVLPGAHWSALTPAAPLRTWQLLTPSGGELLARSPLAIDERVLHLIAGVDELDARLSAVLSPLDPALHRSAPEHAGDLAAVARALAAGPLVELCGADRHTLIALGAAAAERAGLRPQLLRAADIPDELEQRRLLARLWEREALLGTNALLIELTDEARVIERASAFASLLSAPALLLSEQPLNIATLRPIVRHTLAPASAAEQQRIWGLALGPHTAALNGALPRLAAQFSLPPAAIHAATAEALSGQPAVGGDELAQRLWDACRQQARPRLDDLAQRIATQRRWDDIVLPERQLEMLREVTAHVAQRGRVYDQWGFGAELRGSGTSVIFAGGSGTGKTLAAEILANELRLDLYRVDLSGVVSKYIGETEKNLRRIFGAAEYGGAILLFDEADALFGKRSEVKDSHDRYANIEVSYLLQQMESYRGLALLTTNMLENFDRAFLRRVRFVIQFPFPTLEQRAAIWQRAFPAGAPTQAIDIYKLARLNVTGGNIRNIALNAAFLAAHSGEPIGMSQLLRAAVSEYAKLEKSLPDSEIKDWMYDAAGDRHRD